MRLRKNQSGASEVSGEVAKRRRDGRGWGPFSGGQLTIVVVTLAVAIGFPVAASGVISGSNVFVTNATTGKRAAVNTAGALTVAGSVTATQTPPSQAFNAIGEVFFGQCGVIATVPAGKALVVTSMVASERGQGGPSTLEVFANPTCNGNPSAENRFAADGNYQWPFPSGLPIAAGNSLSAQDQDGNSVADVVINGYLVPAAQCTGSSPPAGCN